MILRKLLDLLTRSSKIEQDDPLDEPPLIPPANSNMFKRERDSDEATRPLYRVGKHKPSDFQKIIDMSG
jgi:hypothetical protein